MPWLLAAALAVSTGPAVEVSTGPAVEILAPCPPGDPAALFEGGDPPAAESWSQCRRRCLRDRDCVVLDGACGTFVFAHQDHRAEVEAYQARLKRGAECPKSLPAPRPGAACVAGECRPRTGTCEAEKAAFRGLVDGLPRECAYDDECGIYFLDPEPCRPPYVLRRGLDLRRLEARLAASGERVRLACGHALREHPACSPPIIPFECAKGFCRPAFPP